MELDEKYKMVKEMLDQRIAIDVISETIGLPVNEIRDFFNGEYQYSKNEEEMQSNFNGEPVVRTSIYDSDIQSKTR